MKAILILATLLVIQSISALPTPEKSTDVDKKHEETSDNSDDDIMKKITDALGMAMMYGKGSSNGSRGSVKNIIKATVGTEVVAIDGSVRFEIDGFRPGN